MLTIIKIILGIVGLILVCSAVAPDIAGKTFEGFNQFITGVQNVQDAVDTEANGNPLNNLVSRNDTGGLLDGIFHN